MGEPNPIHRRFVGRYFGYDHLPPDLQEISRPCAELAVEMVKRAEERGKDPAETQAGLRKLLEAKDCFVRAELEDD